MLSIGKVDGRDSAFVGRYGVAKLQMGTRKWEGGRDREMEGERWREGERGAERERVRAK